VQPLSIAKMKRDLDAFIDATVGSRDFFWGSPFENPRSIDWIRLKLSLAVSNLIRWLIKLR
jgi:hypothetical protein